MGSRQQHEGESQDTYQASDPDTLASLCLQCRLAGLRGRTRCEPLAWVLLDQRDPQGHIRRQRKQLRTRILQPRSKARGCP